MNKQLLSITLGIVGAFGIAANNVMAQDGDYPFAVCSSDKEVSLSGTVAVVDSSPVIDRTQTQSVVDGMFQNSLGQFDAAHWADKSASSAAAIALFSEKDKAEQILGGHIYLMEGGVLPGCALK